MRIVIGSDHAGFPLKATIVDHIKSLGHEVHDAGSYDPNPVDFPDIAKAVTSSIVNGQADRGLMVCGTGVGAWLAKDLVEAYLNAEFSTDEDFRRRVRKLAEMDEKR